MERSVAKPSQVKKIIEEYLPNDVANLICEYLEPSPEEMKFIERIEGSKTENKMFYLKRQFRPCSVCSEDNDDEEYYDRGDGKCSECIYNDENDDICTECEGTKKCKDCNGCGLYEDPDFDEDAVECPGCYSCPNNCTGCCTSSDFDCFECGAAFEMDENCRLCHGTGWYNPDYPSDDED